MISGKQLHGLRVIDQNGARLGVVDSLHADPSSGKILGFVITVPGVISGTTYLAAEEVISLDLTGLVVPAKSSLRRWRKNKKRPLDILHADRLSSKKGYVTDIMMDKDRINAVEISQGILHDIQEGRQTIPWNEL
jgi:uncharacterized protein YrrD